MFKFLIRSLNWLDGFILIFFNSLFVKLSICLTIAGVVILAIVLLKWHQIRDFIPNPHQTRFKRVPTVVYFDQLLGTQKLVELLF